MKKNGFSLIELMVTVSIVGILAAIAYPSYMAYTYRAHRPDATSALALYAQGFERCYSQNFTYMNSVTTPCTVPTAATVSPQGYYTITATPQAAGNNGAPPASYSITADVISPGPQANDTSCLRFVLDSAGTQGSTGSATAKTCWSSN